MSENRFSSGVVSLKQSFIEEEEQTKNVFKIPEKEEEVIEEKEKLPKIKLQKRIIKTQHAQIFYGVVFFTSLIGLGFSLYHVSVFSAIASVFGLLLGAYGYKYTEPVRWQSEKLERSRWNAVITFGVLVKSLHPRMYLWRKPLLWTTSIGLGASVFIPGRAIGWFLAMYIIVGLLFMASKEVQQYAKVSLYLSWLMVGWNVIECIFTGSFSFGLIGLSFLLYQIYERLKGIEIEIPEE